MANFLTSARSYFEKTKSWLLKRPALARNPYQPLGNTLQRYTLEDLPPFSLLQADVMLMDPHLVFGLMIRNGAVTQAEVEWTGNETMVKFVSEQWDRIWHDYGGALLRAKRYGWMPFEVIYEEIKEGPFRGMLGVKELRDYHPRDARLMVRDSEKAGVKFNRLLKANGVTLPFPASLWVTYDCQFGNRYGRSILNNAYVPFEEKWRDHGAKDVLRVRMMRDGYSGEIIWAPDEIMTIPDPQTGELKQYHMMDVCRRASETKLAGATMVLPMRTDSSGNEVLKYEPPHDNGRPEGILEWNERLDGEIWEGLGVIKEVAEASETGSGYSGRSIAMTTFLGLVTDEFKWILNDVLHDVLIPLTHINFGRDPDVDGRVKPLVETYAEDVSGTQMGGGAMGGPASGGQGPGWGQQQMMPPQQQGPPRQPQQFAEDDDNPWKPYTGPRGGKGWIDDSGYIRYQDARPGKDDFGNAGSDQPSPKLSKPSQQQGQSDDDELTDVSTDQYADMRRKIAAFAKSKGMDEEQLAVKSGFENAHHMVMTAHEAKEMGFESLADASKKLGVPVGQQLSLALGIKKTRYAGDDFDSFIVDRSPSKKESSVDAGKLREAMENAAKLRELTGQYSEFALLQFREDDPIQKEADGAEDTLSTFLDPAQKWIRRTISEILADIRKAVGDDVQSPALLDKITDIIAALRLRVRKGMTESMVASGLQGFHAVAMDAAEYVPPSPPTTAIDSLGPPSEPPSFPVSGGYEDDAEPEIQFPAYDGMVRDLSTSPVFSDVDYRIVAQQAQEGSFSITGELEAETMIDIRDVLAKNLEEGPNAKKFVDDVQTILTEKNGLSENHLHTVFRANMSSSLSKSMDDALSKPLVGDYFPYRTYYATSDHSVRPEHLAMETLGLSGTNIYNADDPVWKMFQPPWDYNCRCSWSATSIRQAARRGVQEAKDWLARARAMAAERGGEPFEYYEETKPQFEFVKMPDFRPPEDWQRDQR